MLSFLADSRGLHASLILSCPTLSGFSQPKDSSVSTFRLCCLSSLWPNTKSKLCSCVEFLGYLFSAWYIGFVIALHFLTLLVESDHSFPSLFSFLSCYSFVLWCLKVLFVLKRRQQGRMQAKAYISPFLDLASQTFEFSFLTRLASSE